MTATVTQPTRTQPPARAVVHQLAGAECAMCGLPAHRLVIRADSAWVDHGRRRCLVGARLAEEGPC